MGRGALLAERHQCPFFWRHLFDRLLRLLEKGFKIVPHTLSPLLAVSGQPCFRLVICTLRIVRALLCQCAIQIVSERASVIEQANENVSQFHFRHLAMRQVIVHQVLAFALHGFDHFADDQH